MKYLQHLLILFLLFWYGYTLTAQSFTVQGQLTDTLQTPLEGASIVLLYAKDSVLAKFAISNADGSFTLSRVKEGDYVIQASFLGYQTYEEGIRLEEATTLPTIVLEPISQVLGETVVEAERIPIQIKGDTVEYNADAFKVAPNAAVEELLKRLPGIEVDRQGKIKAQGEDVDKILVDGKEFFGNDPKIATKNLPADAVDKVQVFDERSETAKFTGVDDGEREKTINLSLKDGKKKGLFGQIEAGYGSENRFSGKANLNRFTSDLQVSAIGRFNNINQQGFTVQDYFNMMGGMTMAMSGGLTLNPTDLGISFNQEQPNGFVTTGAGGLNLNYDFSKKTEFSVNYFYNQVDRELERYLSRTNFLDESSTFDTEEESLRETSTKNHRINSRFKHTIDSTQDLQVRLNLGFNDALLDNTGLQQNFRSGLDLQNSSDQQYFSDYNSMDITGRLIYRKKFSKAGRSIAADLSLSNTNGEGFANLNSNNFFAPNLLDTLRQRQNNTSDRFSYSTRLSYTEPIGKGQYLSINYRRQDYEEDAAKDFFDIVNEQLFRNNILSNQFINDYIYDQGELTYQYNTKKSKLTLGVSAQQSRLAGDFQSELPDVSRTFFNWLPRLQWRYEFATSKNIDVRYSTQVQAPTIQQLQPVQDNSNPLNVFIGNPDLRPAYIHRMMLHGVLFDQFSFVSLFGMVAMDYTRNKITNATIIDDQLRRITQPVNVDQDMLLRGQLSFDTPIRPLHIKMGISSNFNYNKGILFVNGVENNTDRLNGNVRFRLENRKKQVVDVQVGASVGYTDVQYSVNKEFNQDFFNQSYFSQIFINIKDRWNISSNIEHFIYPQVQFGAQQDLTLWEASVSRYVLKNQRGEIKLSAFDLLNQNVGINRNASLNYVEQERIISLGRYFMLSFVYKLQNFGGN